MPTASKKDEKSWSMEQEFAQMLSMPPNLLAHSIRVFLVARAVIEEMPGNIMSRKNSMDILVAALFHDIGKSTWKHEWFVKPKHQITDYEWGIMTVHPMISLRLLKHSRFINNESMELIKCHHERPDGSGYPNGIEIDITATVLSASDCYAACTEPRLYRPEPLSKLEALREIAYFSPPIVIEAFKRAIRKGAI